MADEREEEAAAASTYQQLPDMITTTKCSTRTTEPTYHQVSSPHDDSLSAYCQLDEDVLAKMTDDSSSFIPNRYMRASRRVTMAARFQQAPLPNQPNLPTNPSVYDCLQNMTEEDLGIKSAPIYSISSRRLKAPLPNTNSVVVPEVSFARKLPSSAFDRRKTQLLSMIREKLVPRLKNFSIDHLSASVQQGIAWCLGMYGYFLGKYPYVMLIFGLIFGLSCASGLRHIKLAPLTENDFFDPNSPTFADRQQESNFRRYGCPCDKSRFQPTTTPKAEPTAETKTFEFHNGTLGYESVKERYFHPLSCHHPDNRGKGCKCSNFKFAFEILNKEKSKHGFVDLDKFQKLLKIEAFIYGNFSSLHDEYFTIDNMCWKTAPDAPCGHMRFRQIDTKELRSALIFNVLPFPYFENSKLMSDIAGAVKTVTDSQGNIWASFIGVLREEISVCWVRNTSGTTAYERWKRSLEYRLDRENARYFEPTLGITVKWHNQDQMLKYPETAMMKLLPKFLATIVAVALWSVVAMTGSDAVVSKPWLGLIGVTSTLLANAAGIGFMAYLGKEFNYACAGVPFLTLAIGLDDMFALATGLHHTKSTDPMPIRMKKTMSDAGSAIFITFMTNLVAQTIGTRTPFTIISVFSTYSLVCMVFDFILQLTIFCPCLSMFAMLEARGRNSCCCCAVARKRDKSIFIRRKPCFLICCSRIDFEPLLEREEGEENNEAMSALMRAVHRYAKFLIKTPARYFVVFLYSAYIITAIYGISVLELGTKQENLAPHNSPDAKFLKMARTAYNSYQDGLVIFDKPLDYRDPEVISDIETIYRKIGSSGFFHPSPKMTRWWLSDYMDFLNSNTTIKKRAFMTRESFFDVLYEEYAPSKQRQWLLDHDMKTCPYDRALVCKTRGHVIGLQLADSTRQIAAYEFARKLKAQYKEKYNMLLFQFSFCDYEVKRSIIYISCYYVLVTVGAATAVAAFFVPNFILIFWIVAMLMSEIIGLVGLLPFLGIDMDLVALTMLIINIGYVVDFIMHLSFDFKIAPGKTRQDKVVHALTDVGHALIPAGCGTIMSVLAMSTTGLYIFEVYFKSLTLAVGISAIHSCLFLPVFLSFFGPLNDAELNIQDEMEEGITKHKPKKADPSNDQNLFNLIDKIGEKAPPRIVNHDSVRGRNNSAIVRNVVFLGNQLQRQSTISSDSGDEVPESRNVPIEPRHVTAAKNFPPILRNEPETSSGMAFDNPVFEKDESGLSYENNNFNERDLDWRHFSPITEEGSHRNHRHRHPIKHHHHRKRQKETLDRPAVHGSHKDFPTVNELNIVEIVYGGKSKQNYFKTTGTQTRRRFSQDSGFSSTSRRIHETITIRKSRQISHRRSSGEDSGYKQANPELDPFDGQNIEDLSKKHQKANTSHNRKHSRGNHHIIRYKK